LRFIGEAQILKIRLIRVIPLIRVTLVQLQDARANIKALLQIG
jgi:hypothetical protein